MKISDFLEPSAISLDLKSPTKQEAIDELCQLLSNSSKIKDMSAVRQALMDREKLGSTGIGQGVAIPHGKTDATEGLVAGVGISRRGVDFEALDGNPVHVFFVLASPADGSKIHLKALARISTLLKDKFCRQALREAKTVEEVKKVISDEDEL